MKILLLTLIIGLYSATGSSQSQCASLFYPQKSSPAYKTNSPLKRFTLSQKADEVSDRLFSEFTKGNTVKEGLELRDKVSVPEFRTPVQNTVLTFENLLRAIDSERDIPSSYYAKIPLKDFLDITDHLTKHIEEGKELLKKGHLEYKRTIFYAYRSSLLFLFLKTTDLQKINPEAFESIDRNKFLDMINASKTYEDATSYSHLVKDELTKNFLMLNSVLNDPLSTLYFMRGMPSLATVNEASTKGSIFISISEKLANIHNQKNYPPFFLTYHDVVHAYTVMKNKDKIFDNLGIKKPTVQSYIEIRGEIEDFLRKIYEVSVGLRPKQKELFDALYNSLTHDFVKNLYHHPIRLAKVLNNFNQFSDFRRETLDRSLRIHQEVKGRDLKLEEINQMNALFDQMMIKNKDLIR